MLFIVAIPKDKNLAGGCIRAEIISYGTELLLGHITDTNATYLVQSLAAQGIDLYYVSQVGDNQGCVIELFSLSQAIV